MLNIQTPTQLSTLSLTTAVRTKEFTSSSLLLWTGSKGVINFPWILYAMQSFVPFGHFRNICGHLFTWLVCGFVFSDAMSYFLQIVSCEKTRQTEEEVGRQHQRMDGPGVRQVPEGSGEQGKWRKLVAKSFVVPQRPSRLRD